MLIISFLTGAFVASMYYRKKITYIKSECEAWEHKAKQAQANMYSDILKNADKQANENTK